MYEYHGNKGSRRQQEIKEPLTLYRAGGFLFISCRRYQTDHLQIYSGGVRILNVQLVSDAAEPKCIVTGCSNKRAPESSYCYLHKPYRRSYTSSYSSGSSGSSSSSSYGKSSGSSSSGSSSYKSSSTSGSSSAASRSSSSYSKPKSSYGTSSYRKSTADSYDDGYDDVYMDGDYDDDRYARDSDYADGVDDALDELGDD